MQQIERNYHKEGEIVNIERIELKEYQDLKKAVKKEVSKGVCGKCKQKKYKEFLTTVHSCTGETIDALCPMCFVSFRNLKNIEYIPSNDKWFF